MWTSGERGHEKDVKTMETSIHNIHFDAEITWDPVFPIPHREGDYVANSIDYNIRKKKHKKLDKYQGVKEKIEKLWSQGVSGANGHLNTQCCNPKPLDWLKKITVMSVWKRTEPHFQVFQDSGLKKKPC